MWKEKKKETRNEERRKVPLNITSFTGLCNRSLRDDGDGLYLHCPI